MMHTRMMHDDGATCVQVWDLHQLKCANTLYGHTKAVLRLQQQGNYLFSVGGPSIRVWDVETGKCVTRILTSRQAGWIRAISVTPDLEMVVGCQDTTLKMYACTAEDLKSCELEGDGSFPVQRTSMSTLPQASSKDNITQQTQPTAPATPCAGEDGYTTPETAIGEVGAGGSAAALVSFDITADQRDVTTPALQGKLDDGHCAAIHAVVCSQKYVCTAGGDCVIRVWNRSDLNPESTMIGHRGPVFALVLLGSVHCPEFRLACCTPAVASAPSGYFPACQSILPSHVARVLLLFI